MKALYDVCAPAKLNLFLHVTGRRADGYHLLQSAFMLIDWCDTLHFEVRRDGKITREDLTHACDNAAGGAAAGLDNVATLLPVDDLCVRAAMALQQEAIQTLGQAVADRLGVHISLLKNIPAQAGMGGGSSDAASTLLALNRLWRLHLPLTQLTRIALPLGADVPFFLCGGNAWVEGIGEKITPLDLPAARFVVAKPPKGLDTARIFSHPDLPRASETAIISGFAVNPMGFGRNDLQGVSRQLCPGIDQGLQWLESLGLAGRMTGSGSAVFAVLPDDWSARLNRGLSGIDHKSIDAKRAGNQDVNSGNVNSEGGGFMVESFRFLAPTGFRVEVCNNLSAHPLAGWAGL